ncbi:hypothetical protein [Nocardia sp. CDC160]|uniref:hypothetical protein n=1 Tax=Nocardia sp. CDC160 TaxID=3112166 RepID=UPI002DB71383|nr:hypothetical protein [Nocardia sp. CDC160]MEC3920145.1 hypothetical protein [Nocardia sp. CDC160]
MPHVAAVALAAGLPPFMHLAAVVLEPEVAVVAGLSLALALVATALILTLSLVLTSITTVVGGQDGRGIRRGGLGGRRSGGQGNGDEGDRHGRTPESSDHVHSSYRVAYQYDP